MSTSKKDYVAIAAILAVACRADGEDQFNCGYESAGVSISKKLADYFATQNPQFDRARFLKACGVSSE